MVPLGMSTSPYPDRIVAKPGFEKELAKRTLTNLYNQRPAWLAQAHSALDAAVAAAYGWADYTPAMPDDEILRRLLALNHERSGAARQSLAMLYYRSDTFVAAIQPRTTPCPPLRSVCPTS